MPRKWRPRKGRWFLLAIKMRKNDATAWVPKRILSSRYILNSRRPTNLGDIKTFLRYFNIIGRESTDDSISRWKFLGMCNFVNIRGIEFSPSSSSSPSLFLYLSLSPSISLTLLWTWSEIQIMYASLWLNHAMSHDDVTGSFHMSKRIMNISNSIDKSFSKIMRKEFEEDNMNRVSLNIV